MRHRIIWIYAGVMFRQLNFQYYVLAMEANAERATVHDHLLSTLALDK